MNRLTPGSDRHSDVAATSLRHYPIDAIDALIAYAKTQDDGCVAHSSEFHDGKPTVTVLVASAANPERAALLYALHQAWYPEDDDD